MEITPLIRLVCKILYWILVYVVFVPPARARNRTKLGWFIIGLLSFPLPVILAIAAGNLLMIDHRDHELVRWYVAYAPTIGAVIGVSLFSYFARKVRSLPGLESKPPAPTNES